MSETHNTMNRTFLAFGLALAIAIGTPLVAGAGETNPKVLGKTYGERSADWWNWAFQFPTATSPFFAEGVIDCSPGQSGNVWYLAGNFGGVSERFCSIPHGKALFFPVLNNNIFIGFPGDTEEAARASSKAATDDADILVSCHN